MSSPIPPAQIANALDAWTTTYDRTFASGAVRDMRRAAALIRDQAAEIAQLKADLAEAQQAVVEIACR